MTVHTTRHRTAGDPRPHLGVQFAQILALVAAMLLLGPFAASAQSTDTDGDGVPDTGDNCVATYNPDQHDDDQDLYGDVCDPDLNNDGFVDALDIAEFKRLMGTGDLEPDLSGDGQVDHRDLGILNSMLGSTPGPRGVTASEIDPPYGGESQGVEPVVAEIDGFDNFPPRPVARIETVNGRLDVVLNEVILLTEDPNEATDLANRYGGVVMTSVDPQVTLGLPLPGMYLIQVNPTEADEATILDGLLELAPHIHGELRGSADELTPLLQMIMEERRNNGLNVSFNSLMERNAIPDRSTVEATSAMSGVPVTYTNDAFAWTTHERDPDLPGDSFFPNDTRVGEAWRVMERAGLLARTSRAMIWDSGFWPNADFPTSTFIGATRTPNTDPTGCGSGAPAPMGSACEAHGTHVVEAGFGLVDNGFGTAGPGGPVANLTLLSSPAIDVGQIIRFILTQIPAALSQRPDVINISSGFDIPAGFCVFACPPLDLMTRVLTDSGILIVASAGNQSRNIDDEDAFCVFGACIPFESSTYAPCELDSVLCIGATEHEESLRASYSNWGTKADANSVDLFAPGDVWSVDARAADSAAASPDDSVQIVSGTSFASPFVAGVATLVNSARASLNGRQIADCLLRTAHTSSASSLIPRRINAVAAVSCARGGRTHPFVEVLNPFAGQSFQQGIDRIPLRASAHDFEDGSSLSVRWSSNLDGFMTSSAPGSTVNFATIGLARGNHVLTAQVTDSTGLMHEDTVNVTVTNPLPRLTVENPTDGSRFTVGQAITLIGTSSDPNETPNNGPLADSQVSWRVNGSYIGTGHTRSYTPTTTGTRDICFLGVDDDGDSGIPACVRVYVDPAPSNDPPVVTISSPISGTQYPYNNVPVEVGLVWTVTDTEDATIPFSQHRVLVGRRASWDSSPYTMVDMTSLVRVETRCLFTNPFTGACSYWQTDYLLDLDPLPGVVTTNVRIEIEATDSTPAPDTGVGSDVTSVSIYNLL